LKPFFFGPPERSLFGVYEGPSSRVAAPRGVVVAYPIGQEALRAHRALRRFSMRVARAGWHTLRFDYYGTGDSAGETVDGEVGQWTGDIARAVDEMKTLQALPRVSLLGLRLGATLAAVAAAGRRDVERLVLWEPVIDGRSFVEAGLAAHRAWVRDHSGETVPPANPGAVVEMLGFPLTPALRSGLEGLDLLRLAAPPAARVLVVEREQTAAAQSLCEHLGRLGAAVDYEHIAEPAIWLRREMDQATVPPQTLERVVAWLGEDAR
jgi:exosortase A-associated hydrolase 2